VAVKIRLKRLGKLKTPHYRIVVADSRKARDGRVIEEIGRYVPTNHPSIIEVNSERALYWLGVGAQPTEQVLVLLKLTGDYQKSKGDASAKNTVLPQIPKAVFESDTKKKPVLKPREEIVVKKQADKVAEDVIDAVVDAAEAEGNLEDVVSAAAEVVAEEAVAEVVEEAAAEAPAEVVEEAAAEAPAEVVEEAAAEAPAEVVAEEAVAEVVEEAAAVADEVSEGSPAETEETKEA
jgi:small subunit ribosomal protein S16